MVTTDSTWRWLRQSAERKIFVAGRGNGLREQLFALQRVASDRTASKGHGRHEVRFVRVVARSGQRKKSLPSRTMGASLPQALVVGGNDQRTLEVGGDADEPVHLCQPEQEGERAPVSKTDPSGSL